MPKAEFARYPNGTVLVGYSNPDTGAGGFIVLADVTEAMNKIDFEHAKAVHKAYRDGHASAVEKAKRAVGLIECIA